MHIINLQKNITIALPKGRIATSSLALFEKICGTDIKFNDRKLVSDYKKFRFLLVRNQDVPVYVEHQASDLGIVGLDVLEECNSKLVRLLDLGIGKCKVVVGSPKYNIIDTTKPLLKVATKMVNIAKSHFASQAMAVEIIKLYGSIELAPFVGLSDVIVDVVETGSTMKQNALKIDEIIMHSSAYLVANPYSFYKKRAEILAISEQLSLLINHKE